MNLTKGTLEQYIDRINSGEPFALARYGDGEFASILGHSGQNCDGVRYSDLLCKALTRTLLDSKSYDYGILAVAVRLFRNSIEKFHQMHDLDIPWIEATFLVAANRHGKLRPFIKCLQKRRIIYVGPSHLAEISKFLPITEHIAVHPTNAFAHWEQTAETILSRRGKGDFIGISCGPTSEVLIHTIYDELKDSHAIMDLGSIWDGYVGVNSRKYMRRVTWKNIREVNLGRAGVPG